MTISVCVDCLLTLTTQLQAGNRGEVGTAIPPPAQFPLPFNQSFDGLAAGMEADFFIDQAGVWEAVRKPPSGEQHQHTGAFPYDP